jgi:hypothetical protein
MREPVKTPKQRQREQETDQCAIEARHRLLQMCNPLMSKWLKQRLTLHRKAAGENSMSLGRPDGLST